MKRIFTILVCVGCVILYCTCIVERTNSNLTASSKKLHNIRNVVGAVVADNLDVYYL